MPNNDPQTDLSPTAKGKRKFKPGVAARVYLDTETLGTLPGQPDVWSIAAYRTTERGRRLDEGLVITAKPNVPLPLKFHEKTIPPGHTEESFRTLLEGSPPLGEFKQQVLEYIGGLPIVAHNASFDINKIEKSLGIALPNETVDTVALSRAVQSGGSHKLQDLAAPNRYNLAVGDAHTASSDALTVAQLYPELVADLRRADPDRLQGMLTKGSLSWQTSKGTATHVFTPSERIILQDALRHSRTTERKSPIIVKESDTPSTPYSVTNRPVTPPTIMSVPADILLAATARQAEPSSTQGKPARPTATQDVGPIFEGATGEYKSYDPVYAARSENATAAAAALTLKRDLEQTFRFDKTQRNAHAQYLIEEYKAKYAEDESDEGKLARNRLNLLGNQADDVNVEIKAYESYGAVKAIFTVAGQMVDEVWVRPSMAHPYGGRFLPAVGPSGHTLVGKRRLVTLSEQPEKVDRDAPPLPMVATERELTSIESMVDVFGRAGIEAFLRPNEERQTFRDAVRFGLQSEMGRDSDKFADMSRPAVGLATQSLGTTVFVKLPPGKTSLEVDEVKRIVHPGEFNRQHNVSYEGGQAIFRTDDMRTFARAGAGIFEGEGDTIISDISADKWWKRGQLTGKHEQLVPYGEVDDQGHVGIDSKRLRQSPYANQFGQRDYGEVQWGFLIDDPLATEVLPEGQMRMSADVGKFARFKQVTVKASHNADGYGVAFLEPNRLSNEGEDELLYGYEKDGDQVRPLYFPIGAGQRAAVEGIEIIPGPGGKAYQITFAEVIEQTKLAKGVKGEVEKQSADWFRNVRLSATGIGPAPVQQDENGNLVGPDGKPIAGMPQHLQFMATSKLWSRQMVDAAAALPASWRKEAGISADKFELADADKLQKYLREKLKMEAIVPLLINNEQRETFEKLPGFSHWDENAKWEHGQVGYRKVSGYLAPMLVGYKPEYPAHKKTLGPELLSTLGLRDQEAMNRLLRKPDNSFKQSPHGRIYAALLQDVKGFSRDERDPKYRSQEWGFGEFQDVHTASSYGTAEDPDAAMTSRSYLSTWIEAMDTLKEEGGKFDSSQPILIDLDKLVPNWQEIQNKVRPQHMRPLEGRLTLPALQDTLAVSAQDEQRGLELNPALNSTVSFLSSAMGGSLDMDEDESSEFILKALKMQGDWDTWFKAPSSRQNALGVRAEGRLMSQVLASWAVAPNQWVLGDQGVQTMSGLRRPQVRDYVDAETGLPDDYAYRDALYEFAVAQERFENEILSTNGKNRTGAGIDVTRYPFTDAQSASALRMRAISERNFERDALGNFLGKDREQAVKLADMPMGLGMSQMGSGIQQIIMRGDQDGDLVEAISSEMFRYHSNQFLKNGEEDPNFGHWTRSGGGAPLSSGQLYGRAIDMMQRIDPDDLEGAKWLFTHYAGREPTDQELAEHAPIWWNERYKQLIEYGSKEFRPYNAIVDDILTAKRQQTGKSDLLFADIPEEERVAAYQDLLHGRLSYQDKDDKKVTPSAWAARAGKPPPRGEMVAAGTKGAYGVDKSENYAASYFEEARQKRMTGFVYNVGRQVQALMGDNEGFAPIASLIATMHQHTIDAETLAEPLRKWMSLSYFTTDTGSYKLLGEPERRGKNGKIGPVWMDSFTDQVGDDQTWGRRFSPFKYQTALIKQVTAMAQMKDSADRPLGFNPGHLAAGLILDAEDPRQEQVAEILRKVRAGKESVTAATNHIKGVLGPDFWTETAKVGPMLAFPFARTLSKQRPGDDTPYMLKHVRSSQMDAGMHYAEAGQGMKATLALLSNRTQYGREDFAKALKQARVPDSFQTLLQMWNQNFQGQRWQGLKSNFQATELAEPVAAEDAPGSILGSERPTRDWLSPAAMRNLDNAKRWQGRQGRQGRWRLFSDREILPKNRPGSTAGDDPLYWKMAKESAVGAFERNRPPSQVERFERRVAGAAQAPVKVRGSKSQRRKLSLYDLMQDELAADQDAEEGEVALQMIEQGGLDTEYVESHSKGGFVLETVKAVGELMGITSEKEWKRADPNKIKIAWDPKTEEMMDPATAATFMPLLQRALQGKDLGAIPPEITGKLPGWQEKAFGGLGELSQTLGWDPERPGIMAKYLTGPGSAGKAALIRGSNDITNTDDTVSEVPKGTLIVPADLRDEFAMALRDLNAGKAVRGSAKLKTFVNAQLARHAPAPAAPPPPAAAGPGAGAPKPYDWTGFKPDPSTFTSLPPVAMPTGGTPLQGRANSLTEVMQAAGAVIGPNASVMGSVKDGVIRWNMNRRVEPKAESLEEMFSAQLDVRGKLGDTRKNELAATYELDPKQVQAAWKFRRAIESGSASGVAPSRGVAAQGYQAFQQLQPLMLSGDPKQYEYRAEQINKVLSDVGLTAEQVERASGPEAQQDLMASWQGRYAAGDRPSAQEREDEVQRLYDMGSPNAGKVVKGVDALLRATMPGIVEPQDAAKAYEAKLNAITAGIAIDPAIAKSVDDRVDVADREKMDKAAEKHRKQQIKDQVSFDDAASLRRAGAAMTSRTFGARPRDAEKNDEEFGRYAPQAEAVQQGYTARTSGEQRAAIRASRSMQRTIEKAGALDAATKAAFKVQRQELRGVRPTAEVEKEARKAERDAADAAKTSQQQRLTQLIGSGGFRTLPSDREEWETAFPDQAQALFNIGPGVNRPETRSQVNQTIAATRALRKAMGDEATPQALDQLAQIRREARAQRPTAEILKATRKRDADARKAETQRVKGVRERGWDALEAFYNAGIPEITGEQFAEFAGSVETRKHFGAKTEQAIALAATRVTDPGAVTKATLDRGAKVAGSIADRQMERSGGSMTSREEAAHTAFYANLNKSAAGLEKHAKALSASEKAADEFTRVLGPRMMAAGAAGPELTPFGQQLTGQARQALEAVKSWQTGGQLDQKQLRVLSMFDKGIQGGMLSEANRQAIKDTLAGYGAEQESGEGGKGVGRIGRKAGGIFEELSMGGTAMRLRFTQGLLTGAQQGWRDQFLGSEAAIQGAALTTGSSLIGSGTGIGTFLQQRANAQNAQVRMGRGANAVLSPWATGLGNEGMGAAATIGGTAVLGGFGAGAIASAVGLGPAVANPLGLAVGGAAAIGLTAAYAGQEARRWYQVPEGSGYSRDWREGLRNLQLRSEYAAANFLGTESTGYTAFGKEYSYDTQSGETADEYVARQKSKESAMWRPGTVGYDMMELENFVTQKRYSKSGVTGAAGAQLLSSLGAMTGAKTQDIYQNNADILPAADKLMGYVAAGMNVNDILRPRMNMMQAAGVPMGDGRAAAFLNASVQAPEEQLAAYEQAFTALGPMVKATGKSLDFGKWETNLLSGQSRLVGAMSPEVTQMMRAMEDTGNVYEAAERVYASRGYGAASQQYGMVQGTPTASAIDTQRYNFGPQEQRSFLDQWAPQMTPGLRATGGTAQQIEDLVEKYAKQMPDQMAEVQQVMIQAETAVLQSGKGYPELEKLVDAMIAGGLADSGTNPDLRAWGAERAQGTTGIGKSFGWLGAKNTAFATELGYVSPERAAELARYSGVLSVQRNAGMEVSPQGWAQQLKQLEAGGGSGAVATMQMTEATGQSSLNQAFGLAPFTPLSQATNYQSQSMQESGGAGAMAGFMTSPLGYALRQQPWYQKEMARAQRLQNAPVFQGGKFNLQMPQSWSGGGYSGFGPESSQGQAGFIGIYQAGQVESFMSSANLQRTQASYSIGSAGGKWRAGTMPTYDAAGKYAGGGISTPQGQAFGGGSFEGGTPSGAVGDLAMHRDFMDLTKQLRVNSEATIALNLSYQRQQIQFARQQAMMSFRQGMENIELSERTWTVQKRQQAEDLTINRGRATIQQGWQREDFGYQQSMAGMQYGWQQEDLDRAIRLSSGRERQNLMRQRSRSQITYGMEESQRGRERSRFETQAGWSGSDFARQKKNMDEINKLQAESFATQKKHLQENFALQMAQLAAQEAHLNAVAALEADRRKLEQDWQDKQALVQEEELKKRATLAQMQAGHLEVELAGMTARMKAAGVLQLLETIPYLPGGDVWNAGVGFVNSWLNWISIIEGAVKNMWTPPSGGGNTTPPPPPGKASGGVSFTPQYSYWAEAGPEAIIPLNQLPRIMAQMSGSMTPAGNNAPAEAGPREITIRLDPGQIMELLAAGVVRTSNFERGVNVLARNQSNRGF